MMYHISQWQKEKNNKRNWNLHFKLGWGGGGGAVGLSGCGQSKEILKLYKPVQHVIKDNFSSPVTNARDDIWWSTTVEELGVHLWIVKKNKKKQGWTLRNGRSTNVNSKPQVTADGCWETEVRSGLYETVSNILSLHQVQQQEWRRNPVLHPWYETQVSAKHQTCHSSQPSDISLRFCTSSLIFLRRNLLVSRWSKISIQPE